MFSHEPVAAVDTVSATRRFDSTRGFPGEGPTDLTPKPWFLEDAGTQSLLDRKRRRASVLAAAPHVRPAALPAPPTDRRLLFESPLDRKGTRVAHRTLGSKDSTFGRSSPQGNSTSPTPVPQGPSPQVPAFTTPREQRDFLTPLPIVPAGQSLRRVFIKHFGGLRGMDTASFDEVWKVAKNGHSAGGFGGILAAAARARGSAPLAKGRIGIGFDGVCSGLRWPNAIGVPSIGGQLSEICQAKRGSG